MSINQILKIISSKKNRLKHLKINCKIDPLNFYWMNGLPLLFSKEKDIFSESIFLSILIIKLNRLIGIFVSLSRGKNYWCVNRKKYCIYIYSPYLFFIRVDYNLILIYSNT